MPPPTHLWFAVAAFVFGALWGSFLNVVIFRLPRGESVIHPPSHCGACGTPIRAWHNLPILSWVLLRGRCATCRAPFSVRYPLVELAVAVLSLAIWTRLAHGPPAPLYDVIVAYLGHFVFILALVAIAFIDLDTMRIPDALSLPPILVGLLLALGEGPVTGVGLEQSLLGTLVGGGSLLAITWGYFALTRRHGMGLGDFRLMAMVGAFLGVRSLLFVLMASALQGLVFAVAIRTFRVRMPDYDADDETVPEASAESPPPEPPSFRQLAIPYGPFIALAAVEWLLFERPLLALVDRVLSQSSAA